MTPLHPKVMMASLVVTVMTEATVQAATPAPGIFGDPVVAVILRGVSIVLSLALSGTIIIACIKMIAYFGAAGEAQRNLSGVVKEAGEKFDEFAKEMRTLWQTHDREITILKTNHEGYERRFEQIETHFHRRRED